ncbi:DUF1521 domain-containing protein [Corallococcus llansteffanensis]|uniref:DUF1521 domain-containing protein n=1 Tax=Corallococcus llansteffanensis TaxID=2316731 RepID=UPI001FC95918|nr:DUF1521 domain-containing protein [Corallococcus llansteffanensis]
MNDATLAKNAKLIESTMGLVEKALAGAPKAAEKAAKPDQMGRAVSTQQTAAATSCFPTEKPDPLDGFSPARTLEVKDNKVTTPGGYTIETIGQFEWKVTGPDGKSTRIWGDPHVAEGDGGTWDFKKDTTFTLGDGTMINVTTKPYGNGMTVSGQLDIVCMDSHVRISDLDKGKGTIGPVQQDGVDEAARFHGREGVDTDTVEMGNATDDWLFEGHEIIGSENGGETLKKAENATITNHVFGGPPNTMASPGSSSTKTSDALAALQKRFDAVGLTFDSLKKTQTKGFNPFSGADGLGTYNKAKHKDGLKAAFDSVTSMLKALQKIPRFDDTVRPRNIFF